MSIMVKIRILLRLYLLIRYVTFGAGIGIATKDYTLLFRNISNDNYVLNLDFNIFHIIFWIVDFIVICLLLIGNVKQYADCQIELFVIKRRVTSIDNSNILIINLKYKKRNIQNTPTYFVIC